MLIFVQVVRLALNEYGEIDINDLEQHLKVVTVEPCIHAESSVSLNMLY